MAFIQEGCITAARLHRANSIFNCSGRLSQMIRCTFFFLFDSERTVLTTAPTTRTGCQYPDTWSDQGFMRERGLSLSPTKTKITHIAKGFDFLGQNIRKYDGKLLITPAKKNVQAFLTKIRSVVKDNWAAEQKNLIGLLNPMIKGWADYHRHVVSKKVFARVDSEIWRVLW